MYLTEDEVSTSPPVTQLSNIRRAMSEVEK